MIPNNFKDIDNLGALKFYVDASQTRQVSVIQRAIETSLLSVERKIRNIEPLFDLQLEDVKARPQRYIDFLLPGLLAFMIMNLSIAGSGFNIVEYRRRGILKRLFVTPIKPGFYYFYCLSKNAHCPGSIVRCLVHSIVFAGYNNNWKLSLILFNSYPWHLYFSLHWICAW